MRIGRRYKFEAAHFLPLVPEGHRCKNMHGHNFAVEVVIEGQVVRGFVKDFADLDAIVSPLIKRLDHSVVNTTLSNPTSELIAEWLAAAIADALLGARLVSVRVYENDDCWAEAEA